MKKLENEFIGSGDVSGKIFRKVNEDSSMYIYGILDSSGKDISYYEVFERRVSRGGDRIINGVDVHFEERELYPTSNAFGVWAWCCGSYDRALEVFTNRGNIIRDRERIKGLSNNLE